MTKLTPVQQVRRKILQRLIRERFGGNASEASRKAKSSHQYVWQVTSGHRGMGDRAARKIERALKLFPYALDGARTTTSILAQFATGEGAAWTACEMRLAKHCQDLEVKLARR
jgi:hypothetical protein